MTDDSKAQEPQGLTDEAAQVIVGKVEAMVGYGSNAWDMVGPCDLTRAFAVAISASAPPRPVQAPVGGGWHKMDEIGPFGRWHVERFGHGADHRDESTAAMFELWCDAKRPAAPGAAEQPPHSDHPMRHYDRTCPACNWPEQPVPAPQAPQAEPREVTAREHDVFTRALRRSTKAVQAEQLSSLKESHEMLLDPVPLTEPVYVNKALMAHREARVCSESSGKKHMVLLVNIQLRAWSDNLGETQAWADGFNSGIRALRAAIRSAMAASPDGQGEAG